jgi:hypothetical protein
MVGDQKYCLECGKRKGDPRVQYGDYMTDGVPGVENGSPPMPPAGRPAAPPYPDDPRPVREITPLMAAGGLMAFAVILLLGVLVGRLGGTESQAPVVAATGLPTTAAAVPGAGGATSTDVNVTFTADWPSGKEGFTIELATVAKDSTDAAGVAATKADLAAKGAAEVGALDSDEFASLPGGNYVFYNGVYETKPEAAEALKALASSFPDAQVIEVSIDAPVADEGGGGGGGGGGSLITDSPETADPDKAVQASKDELESINEADAADYQELQQKLPPTIQTPGKAPPTDGKAPGDGSEAVEIG